jgi:DNA-binding HxlR family transcriptional regulator
LRPYRQSLDKKIIATLFGVEELNYSELYREVGSPSHDVFSRHLKQLAQDKVIRKEDDGTRGKTVHYSLFPKVRSKFEKGILSMGDKPDSNEKIYQKLMLLDINPFTPPLSEKEINDILIDMGRKWDDFRVIGQETKVDLVDYKEHSITYEDGATGIRIEKRLKIFKGKENIVYHCKIPGVSAKDIVENEKFFEISANLSEVEEILKVFYENEIIIRTGLDLGNFHRYKIKNYEVKKAIEDFWNLFVYEEWRVMNWKWKEKRPTTEEVNWINSLLGKKEAKSYFTQFAEERAKNTQRRITLSYEATELTRKDFTLARLRWKIL